MIWRPFATGLPGGDASERGVFISQVITRDDERDFTEEELFPIEEIIYEGFDRFTLVFKDRSRRIIDYSGIEGRLTL